MKYSGTSSYEAPRKLISCSGPSCTSALRVARGLGVRFEKILCNSLSFYAFDFCNDRKEYFLRIGDIGVN